MRDLDPARLLSGIVVGAVLSSGLGCHGVGESRDGEDRSAQCSLELSMPSTVSLKDFTRSLEVTLVNRGKDPVTIVVPGDGSSCAWRTPRVGWSILPAASSALHPDETPLCTTPRCGNINALKSDEIRDLAPDASCELGEWIGLGGLRLEPGEYRVRFYYENVPSLEWSGMPLGKHEDGAMDRVQRSTPLRLRSDEFRVVVTK